MRARQRLREGREKPSDVVAKDLHLAAEFDMESQEPYSVFAGLTLAEMRELHEDILLWQVLLTPECRRPNHLYLMLMIACCNDSGQF